MARRSKPRRVSIATNPAAHHAGVAQRSTIRTAQARRTLADALPDLIYSPPEPARKRVVEDDRPARVPVGQTATPRRKPTVAETRQRDVKPALREIDRCKGRPISTKRSGGSGGSRQFVPWCR